MTNPNKLKKKRAETALEEYYEQSGSTTGACGDEFFIGFYARARAAGDRAFQNIIVADAAAVWGMFADEVEDFLNRKIRHAV